MLSSEKITVAGGAATGLSDSSGPILVVDNEQLARELMTRILTREGFQVAVAASGAEALRLARELRPAAITLDVDMPGMDGWTVLTTLKADPDLADIPVIMTTMVDERNKGYALGVADYMIKPIERHRLAAVLKKFQSEKSQGPVLIVEDDAANREILVRREGWPVVEAENGRAALERVKETPPALILLDLMLPELDDFGLVRELRASQAFEAIPVVILTAKDLDDADRLQLTGRVRKIFQKGAYSRDDLLREICGVIARTHH